jgi:hypothetical protein
MKNCKYAAVLWNKSGEGAIDVQAAHHVAHVERSGADLHRGGHRPRHGDIVGLICRNYSSNFPDVGKNVLEGETNSPAWWSAFLAWPESNSHQKR